MNERWSMDFVGDSLADGRTFRTLNIVDDCSREAPPSASLWAALCSLAAGVCRLAQAIYARRLSCRCAAKSRGQGLCLLRSKASIAHRFS